MSQLLARIMLAFFVMPMGCLVYLITFVTCEDWIDHSSLSWELARRLHFGFAGTVTWVVAAVWWSLVWRKSVKWNATRIGFTIACSAVAVVVALMIAAVIDGTDGSSRGSFIGSMAAPFFWLVGTIFVWRETSAERAARVDRSGRDSIVCPTCGYNLTGLKESRCPECGTQFTLDQLLASQPSRVQGEIEG